MNLELIPLRNGLCSHPLQCIAFGKASGIVEIVDSCLGLLHVQKWLPWGPLTREHEVSTILDFQGVPRTVLKGDNPNQNIAYLFKVPLIF